MAHEMIASKIIGDKFSGVYFVETANVRQTTAKKDFMDLVLRDKSGSRPVKYWGLVKGVEAGGFVFAAIEVETYQGNASFVARNLEPEREPEDKTDYVEVADGLSYKRDKIAAMNFSDPVLSAIWKAFQASKAFTTEKYFQAPADKTGPWAKEGGLIDSTYGLLQVLDCNGLSGSGKEITVLSALLGQIGVMDSYTVENLLPCETNMGLLIGTNNLTMNRVFNLIRDAKNHMKENGIEDNGQILQLLHCITSVFGGTVLPSTKEALYLSTVWQGYKTMAYSSDFISKAEPKNGWTSFDTVSGRKFFVV